MQMYIFLDGLAALAIFSFFFLLILEIILTSTQTEFQEFVTFMDMLATTMHKISMILDKVQRGRGNEAHRQGPAWCPTAAPPRCLSPSRRPPRPYGAAEAVRMVTIQ